ncbi:DUF1643 domain-containing protein [Nostoc sp. FACHB-190]|uniref:DUF1643 domain-containing protein n=1 Tax=Nostoc sp. FACHB-190 TaxID=2692838 RepID=UPI00168626CA|nr:DUF1643 domain-containing protein [Nostoc sp. FACHB-190]MBD2303195.1 DUF1643 domain-containing protein [Nostoc sp. FACHB-190]
MKKFAVINDNYRYLLVREWDINKPQITFVMLNPSTADAEQDDPTLRKCINFAQSWGYGSLEVVNLFAYRATKPRHLRQVADPVGSENDYYLQLATKRAALIIVAWGVNGSFQNRNQEVLSLISGQQLLYCLGVTKHGHPRHPLYIKNNTQLIIF